MYKLIKEGEALRLSNINDYIELDISTLNRSGEILIGFVTFNNPTYAAKIAHILNYYGYQVIIIDNHSTHSNYVSLAEAVEKFTNVRLIRANANLGGAGGYALICEVFLRTKYKYLLLTEDDAMPAESDLINQIINQKDKGDIVNCIYYNNNSDSFSFHYTLYSRRLMIRCGIPDPRFFQGGDDADFLRRQRDILNNEGWKTFRVQRGYYHPTLKGNGTPSKVIRSQRNALLSEIGASHFPAALIRSIAFLTYGFYYLFVGNLYVFRSVLFSWSSVRLMGVGADPYISDSKLNISRDLILKFKFNASISGLTGKLGTTYLKGLFAGLGLQSGNNIILATLDSPWAIVHAPFNSRAVIVKNLSTDFKCVDTAEYKFSFVERILASVSIVLSLVLAPIFLILYIFSYRKFYKI